MIASSTPGATTSAPIPPAKTSEPDPRSKAWIAGAVVGGLLALALIGAGVWSLLRRRKKAVQLPQHGSATMAPVDPNQPPTGVEGYSDAKPRFPAQPTYYDRPGQPNSYTQQGYPQQGGFSPAPQYGVQSAYNANSNLHAGAPPHEIKYEGIGGTAELGGDDNAISPGTVPVSELSGIGAERPGEGPASNYK